MFKTGEKDAKGQEQIRAGVGVSLHLKSRPPGANPWRGSCWCEGWRGRSLYNSSPCPRQGHTRVPTVGLVLGFPRKGAGRACSLPLPAWEWRALGVADFEFCIRDLARVVPTSPAGPPGPASTMTLLLATSRCSWPRCLVATAATKA